MNWHIDYETTSAADIKLGAYRYACDPSTRILMFAIAVDEGCPKLWNFLEPDAPESIMAKQMLIEAVKPGNTLYAHNAQFEIAVSRYRLAADVGIEPPPLTHWRCTATMARRAAIPSSLAKASEFLRLADKDKKGKVLINIFSDQTKAVLLTQDKDKVKSFSPLLDNPILWDAEMTVSGERVTVRQAWQDFMDYCRQDVIVEQQIHKALKPFELSGMELEGFQFDIRMNDAGIPVNRAALEHANRLLDEEAEHLNAEFKQLTGLMPSQTTKVLAWLRERGYAADNMQAKTMEAQLDNPELTEEAHRALEIRATLSFAAVKKIPAMLNTACPDDRMRGLFTYYGASGTGRWTSSGPQVQNAKKPTIKSWEEAFQDIKEGQPLEWFDAMHGRPYEVIASCVRNFIEPHHGKMIDSDFSNIESRVAAWLAGCESELDLYRKNIDAYASLAAEVFNIPYEHVTKPQRFVGKVGVLSLVFATGAKKFFETCANWGNPISKEIAIRTVKVFRSVKHEFPSSWRSFEAAATKAIENTGNWFDAGHIKFGYTLKGPFPRLLMRLPSGRDLVYPKPSIHRSLKRHTDWETGETREWESNEIWYEGPGANHQWGVQTIHGALFYQNATQATARDILLHGCLQAERAGFKIWAVIHDQALADEGDVDAFEKALCTLPAWLPADFPLAAESSLVDRYAKD
jgi:DNA polymerase